MQFRATKLRFHPMVPSVRSILNRTDGHTPGAWPSPLRANACTHGESARGFLPGLLVPRRLVKTRRKPSIRDLIMRLCGMRHETFRVRELNAKNDSNRRASSRQAFLSHYRGSSPQRIPHLRMQLSARDPVVVSLSLLGHKSLLQR